MDTCMHRLHAYDNVPVRRLLSDCADWREGLRPKFSKLAGWLPLLPHIKLRPISICIWVYVRAMCLSALQNISPDFLPPQQWIDDLQCVSVCGAEAAPFLGFRAFLSTCTSAGLGLSLGDDTQRKGPCDGVKDHSAWGLGNRLAPANIESDQSGNVVKAILLELEQLPWVALTHRWRYRQNISNF